VPFPGPKAKTKVGPGQLREAEEKLKDRPEAQDVKAGRTSKMGFLFSELKLTFVS
jgi:hypothetical protein